MRREKGCLIRHDGRQEEGGIQITKKYKENRDEYIPVWYGGREGRRQSSRRCWLLKLGKRDWGHDELITGIPWATK